MNNLKKIGLTALAASLTTVSANAVDITASGSAGLYMTSNSNVGAASTGNPFSMDDTVNFKASGELDNGFTVTMTMGLDGSKNAAGSVFEDRAMSINMNDMGTLTFNAQDGSSVTGAMDDKMPTAYEESWFQADGPGNGSGANNMFNYSNSSIDGITLMASFTPSGSGQADSSSDVGLTYSGIEGLTIGLASGTDAGAGASADVDNTTKYITYAYDAFTLGVQANSMDSEVAGADEEYSAYAVSYAVSDAFSVSYGYSELDYEGVSTITDESQEASAISMSYTAGGMSLAATRSDVENEGGNKEHDGAGYEVSLSFAF